MRIMSRSVWLTGKNFFFLDSHATLNQAVDVSVMTTKNLGNSDVLKATSNISNVKFILWCT